MTKAKTTPAEREKIETLIREGGITAREFRSASPYPRSYMTREARLLDDLADIAQLYLEELKG